MVVRVPQRVTLPTKGTDGGDNLRRLKAPGLNVEHQRGMFLIAQVAHGDLIVLQASSYVYSSGIGTVARGLSSSDSVAYREVSAPIPVAKFKCYNPANRSNQATKRATLRTDASLSPSLRSGRNLASRGVWGMAR